MLVAGVDVGGTNIGAGLVDEHHRVHVRSKRDTPQLGPRVLADAIIESVRALGHHPAAVGLGIPGVIFEGQVAEVPNLAGWEEPFDLPGTVSRELGLPVALGNDVNVGLRGEWLAGAAKGHDQVLGVWMGTGIGGGLILDGQPFDGARGAAGEIGHVITHRGGALCGCGRRGCVEAYAGRRSLAAMVTAMVDAGRHTRLLDIQREEGKATLTARVWAKALAEGDELAVELFDIAIEVLAVGVGSVLNVLDLELVVIGGGMAQKMGQPLADRIGAESQQWILHPSPELTFVAATLGDDSGLVGAASAARDLLARA